MKKLIGKLLFPFRATLVVLMPVLNILMLPLRIIRAITKLGIGFAGIAVVFGGEPIVEVLKSSWLIILTYLVMEFLLAIPYVVLEMVAPRR